MTMKFLKRIKHFCRLLSLALLSGHAWCLDPGGTLATYNHRIWTSKDGAPAFITLIAQTPDGWLWLGGKTGLYRFDGIRFYPYMPPAGTQLLGQQITQLSVQPNGDLYIAYSFGGLSVRHADGRLEHLVLKEKESPVRTIYALVLDVDGSIWLGTVAGVMHFSKGQWSKVEFDGLNSKQVVGMLALDSRRRLWAGTGGALFQYDRERNRFSNVSKRVPEALRKESNWQKDFIISSNGRMWVGDGSRYGLVEDPQPLALDPLGRVQVSKLLGLGTFDQNGNLWALNCPTGMCLAISAESTLGHIIDVSTESKSRFDQPWQMSSLNPLAVFEDREGSIWIGTTSGVERFKNNALTPVPFKLPGGFYHIVPDDKGSVWIVEPLMTVGWRFNLLSGHLESLPGKSFCVTAAANGLVVLSRYSDILINRSIGEDYIAYPTDTRIEPDHHVVGCALYDGDRLWLRSIYGEDYVWENNEWYPTKSRDYPAASHYRWAGKSGELWVGLDYGGLAQFIDGHMYKTVSSADLHNIGTVTHLSLTPEIVAAGESGIAVKWGGKFRRLSTDVDEILHNVTGFYVDADGTRWLNGGAGLLRVELADWRAAVEHGASLRYYLFDGLDGYPGVAQSMPRENSLIFIAGKLWVNTSGGIMQIDPKRREHNPVPPRPDFLALSGDDLVYHLSGRPAMRPGTRRIRIDFTAPSLSKPERLVFSYRLDGADANWQNTRERGVTYTSLPPGSYRFRLRAMNEDGVWSIGERTLDLRVDPTPTQTWWFKTLCIMAAMSMLLIGHRLRTRVLTRRLADRMRAQLEERERIARDLHDTVLQTFQSVVLKVKAASLGERTDAATRTALELSLRAANDAIEEGRDKVSSLRGRGHHDTLCDYLRTLGEFEAGTRSFSFRCESEVRVLRPEIEEELRAIGREALCNAFRHANASKHEVVIEFGPRELVLTILDNGRGIAPEDICRPGHWGLLGIEERARAMQANAVLQSSPGAGSVWQIRLRAALAYADHHPLKRLIFMRR
jgi:signal transduction histidine kinase/ligand-binding sensor domain-containing protein